MAELDQTALQKIRERLERSSPGPWVPESGGSPTIRTGRPDGKRFHIRRELDPASDGDVAFIARARSAIPRLLDALGGPGQPQVSDAELEAIDAAIARASGGPWTAFIEEAQPIGGCSMIWAGDEPDAADMYVWLEDAVAPAADIEFIATARQDLPLLLSEVRFRRNGGGRSA
jgi:hypothetical protein